MSILNRKEAFVLLIGDILLFLIALCITLILRYGAFWDKGIFYMHLAPFSFLFLAWLFVFFIAGLYEKHTLLRRGRLPHVLLKAVTINIFMAVIFFYFIPYFGIAPKVNLFIYLVVSFVLILLWRMYGYRLLYVRKKQNAIIIGTGSELSELALEVNQNERYYIRFLESIEANDLYTLDFNKSIIDRVESEHVTLIALDINNQKIESILPPLYNLIFKNVEFVDMYRLYEEIFDRVPLSLLKYSWFLEHVSVASSAGYDALKRIMDLVLSFILGAISLVLYPFIIAAIKLDDGGPAFIFQERVGLNGSIIKTIKFRTMTRDDGGVIKAQKDNQPTRVGPFLRKSRLDELPQFWNIIRGDLSLIGPRPELPALVSVYEKEVPYYNIRHLIKPGLSGWAQLYHDNHPHHHADVHETRVKLSYDLFYIKNRSLFLDLKIALKTMKTLLSRSGL
ncbi:MAG: Sugar transferase [Parcubacteria group bacterium GW2011_GWA2_44_15]|nr:MAG: Sugar transferase [Parcubacteria group bacterium GW2011_GWA2_44_15]